MTAGWLMPDPGAVSGSILECERASTGLIPLKALGRLAPRSESTSDLLSFLAKLALLPHHQQ